VGFPLNGILLPPFVVSSPENAMKLDTVSGSIEPYGNAAPEAGK
jgi:hypothetical protein